MSLKSAPMVQSRSVKSKISSRPTAVNDPKSKHDQLQKFREERKARELEKLQKQREARLLRSAQAVASNCTIRGPLSGTVRPHAVNKKAPTPTVLKASTSLTVPSGLRSTATSVRQNLSGFCKKPMVKPRKSVGVTASKINATKRKSTHQSLKSKSIPKKTVATVKAVKHTKASQLRLIHGNPVIEIAFHAEESVLQNYSPLKSLSVDPSTANLSFLKKQGNTSHLLKAQHERPLNTSAHQTSVNVNNRSTSGSVFSGTKPKTPSKIPVKKASFASSPTSPVRTPKPAHLREKLQEWLESHGRAFDDFKHLSCFGIKGSAVKRPQTPFRKKILSTSILQSIPENKEASPLLTNSQLSDEDVFQLDTTFTIEDEDKENMPGDSTDNQKKVSISEVCCLSDESNSMDKAQGVLSELLKLIQMGYPSDQYELWLRAVRRRFPQCGDEVVYWECLAALEKARGDLKTAVACYERALAQGGEDSIQSSLDELKHKLEELNIETACDTVSANTRRCRDEGLNCLNIIQSSAIEFFVQEKVSSKIDSTVNSFLSESVVVATPVRRSTRNSTTQPFSSCTPKRSCVKSLDVLESSVRKTLVFRTNSALDPQD